MSAYEKIANKESKIFIKNTYPILSPILKNSSMVFPIIGNLAFPTLGNNWVWDREMLYRNMGLNLHFAYEPCTENNNQVAAVDRIETIFYKMTKYENNCIEVLYFQ